jgi:hypothetical protein
LSKNDENFLEIAKNRYFPDFSLDLFHLFGYILFMNKIIDSLSKGLNILTKYSQDGEISYVANSFPNGSPNHPARCFVSVEMGYSEVTTDEHIYLADLGWILHDGEVWRIYY